jgi:anthranilate phosphoribosyltransferase
MGIFHQNLTEVQVNVLKALGSSNVMVFHGMDGLDEISTSAPTQISEMFDGGDIKTYKFDALDLGLDRVNLQDLQGGEPSENAKLIKNILNGSTGPKRDIVLLNAAAGIVVGGKAKSLKEGMKKATESIDSGAANEIMNKLII